jgi:hypothetical protein
MIEYDKEIEVTKKQYQIVRKELNGICALRTTGFLFWKRYYVKLWLMGFRRNLEQILNYVP